MNGALESYMYRSQINTLYESHRTVCPLGHILICWMLPSGLRHCDSSTGEETGGSHTILDRVVLGVHRHCKDVEHTAAVQLDVAVRYVMGHTLNDDVSHVVRAELLCDRITVVETLQS